MGGAPGPAGARSDDVAGAAPAGQYKRPWQPGSATKRRGPRGGRPSPPAIPSRSSWSTRAAPHRADPALRLGAACPASGRVGATPPRQTLVAALTPHGLPAPWTSAGAIAPLAFERSVQQGVGPTLRPGHVVSLDHLSVHTSVHTAARLQEASEAVDGARRFLPPDSPDCPPSEPAFSKSKALRRGLGARPRAALREAVRQAVTAITADDAAAWFGHAGYPLPAPPS